MSRGNGARGDPFGERYMGSRRSNPESSASLCFSRTDRPATRRSSTFWSSRRAHARSGTHIPVRCQATSWKERRPEHEGRPTTAYKAGEAFYVDAGKIHVGINDSTAPLKFLATLVVEKGKPAVTPRAVALFRSDLRPARCRARRDGAEHDRGRAGADHGGGTAGALAK